MSTCVDRVRPILQHNVHRRRPKGHDLTVRALFDFPFLSVFQSIACSAARIKAVLLFSIPLLGRILTCLAESWVEIASQPSSSSLSSAADDIPATRPPVHLDVPARRKRRVRLSNAPNIINASDPPASSGGSSSQEEYEESESESDRVMTSSNEGLELLSDGKKAEAASASDATDDEDENRTAVNYPIRSQNVFTPQPNAFSHPTSAANMRNVSEPYPGSYFPNQSKRPAQTTRHSYSGNQTQRVQHSPYNIISPSHNAAADHDAALRASLSTLLSCAAAARSLGKAKAPQTATLPPSAPTRIQPSTLRLVPESELLGESPVEQQPLEPAFPPTIRRHSASTSTSADSRPVTLGTKEGKRKATSGRSSSKDRRFTKKARRVSSTYNADDIFVSPTLLTWVVSAGVVVVLSALSFSAGYTMGKEAGKLDASLDTASAVDSCARQAGRSGLGLRRLQFTAQT